jgi:N-acetylglucosaminyldiphosphoundecaprenol N-acetyl-beta-D-mannosaminyltransferase
MNLESPSRIDIAGAGVHGYSFREAVDRIIERARTGGEPAYVVTPNAHHVCLLRDSEEFRRIYDHAWLSLADGTPLVWASRILGTPVPEKVSGSDLLPAICKAIAGTGLRVFFLGGRPGAADAAAQVLQERYPGLSIAGTYCPPMGFERDPAESARAVEAVRAARPDILFVGLGAPKQEIWMYENRERLGVPVSLGVGVSFEFVAGLVKRAPKWMRKAGLEWFYRLAAEPRRLWKRYAVTNPRFMWLVANQYAGSRRSG